MNTHAATEPELREDFADRVLEAVDRRLVLRWRRRWVFGASAVCLGVAAVVMWKGIPWASQPAAPAGGPIFAAASASLTEVGANSADPLSYMFPDAAPLARFAAEDGATGRDEGAEALFDDGD